jgi:hypothetical protein
MLTIHKYDLYRHVGRVAIPVGATVLCIQYQDNKPFLWAKVDTDKPLRPRQFVLYGTGWGIENDDYYTEVYISTVQDKDGLVWHWFEVV